MAPVGRDGLETEGLGDGKQVGEVVDTAGYMLVGMDQREVADKC